MTIQTINIGTVANDGTGDTPRQAGEVINSNFTDPANAASKLVGTSFDQIPLNSSLRANTIADLRALIPTTDGQQVSLLGHTIAGIGGGTFYYDASDTTSSDDGEDVVVTTGSARWKRLTSTEYINTYKTLTAAINSSTLRLGQTVDIKDISGSGGSALWDVVLSSSVTANADLNTVILIDDLENQVAICELFFYNYIIKVS